MEPAGWPPRHLLHMRPEVADFSKAVAPGAAPIATGVDGMRAVAVADALYRAAEEGRTVQVDVA